ncbi:MAG: hypothetical protein IJV08_11505 [Bacteroidaceae bacterium]|nr:hypothetical protein [Bacteroidaceae bacterium]MBR1449517.1 hypothetical protein [Prevotella sp.]
MNDNRYRRPQDDLPYERRMLYIIRDYRRLLEANERLAAYARSLEQRIEELEDKRARQAMANKAQREMNTQYHREIKRLKAHIDWLREQLPPAQ